MNWKTTADKLAHDIKAAQLKSNELFKKQTALQVQIKRNESIAWIHVCQEKVASIKAEEPSKYKYTNDKLRTTASEEFLGKNSDHQNLLSKAQELADEKRLSEIDLELLTQLLKNTQYELRRLGKDSNVVVISGEVPE